jgi:hypothetical protein
VSIGHRVKALEAELPAIRQTEPMADSCTTESIEKLKLDFEVRVLLFIHSPRNSYFNNIIVVQLASLSESFLYTVSQSTVPVAEK